MAGVAPIDNAATRLANKRTSLSHEYPGHRAFHCSARFTMYMVFTFNHQPQNRMRQVPASLVTAIGIVVLAHGPAFAQMVRATPSPVMVDGRITLSSEFYNASGIRARRPASLSRAILQPTITLFDQVVLPFEIFVSTEDRGFRQPFNQFGVSPRLFGWMTLHAGYYSARLSDLTFGDSRLLGGGVELTPGNFRFTFLYGRAQQAVEQDTVAGSPGAFDRTLWAARIGVGKQTGAFVDLTLMHAVDDSTSMHAPPVGTSPKENAVASLAFGIPFGETFARVSGEVAVSALSNDTRSEEFGADARRFAWLFTARTSSQVDAAARFTLLMNLSKAVSMGLNARWVGPGFVTLGYQQLQNDLLDATITPAVRVLDNRLVIRGSFGLRFNNLRGNRLSTTRRVIGTFNATVQPGKEFGVDLQYANYGMRSTPRNDTLRIENVTQSVSVVPRYAFSSFGGMSTLSASYSYQSYTDNNIVTSSRNGRTSHTGGATWSLMFPSTLSFATRVSGTGSSTALARITIINLGETVGHSFFGKKLVLSGTVGYSVVRVTETSGQLMGALLASYSLGDRGRIALSLTVSQFDDSDPGTDALYRETVGRLQYSHAF